MRSLAASLLLVLGLTALAGCGVLGRLRGSSDSPEQAFARLRAALESRDWAAVYSAAVSPSTHRIFERDFQNRKSDLMRTGGETMYAKALGLTREEYVRMGSKDFFVRTSAAAGKPATWRIPNAEKMRKARIVDTKVEDDKATLFLDIAGRRDDLNLRREDGRWYLDLLRPD